MLCRRISSSTAEPAWRCNSVIGPRRTLIFSRRLVLTPDRLRSKLPFFRDLDPADPDTWVHRKRDNLEAFVNRGGVVKIAFFGGLDTLHRIEDPRRAAGSRVRVASLVDLAGMKMRVIQVRGSWKDYVDIHTLVLHGIDVPTGLAAAKAIVDLARLPILHPKGGL